MTTKQAESREYIAAKLEDRIEKTSGCWIWKGSRIRRRYGSVRVCGVTRSAHRVAYETWCGPIGPGLFVCHKCDNPPCIRPDHLFLGTHADNMRDKALKGRSPRGERSGARRHPERLPRGEGHSSAKLTEEAVHEIDRLYLCGDSYAQLAAQYGVDIFTIRDVVKRRTWKHVPFIALVAV